MSAKMDEQALLALLRELAIDSQRVEHPAIASIEEYYAQGIELPDQGIKNLFLRNRKGTRHYLVLLDERRRPTCRASPNRSAKAACRSPRSSACANTSASNWAA